MLQTLRKLCNTARNTTHLPQKYLPKTGKNIHFHQIEKKMLYKYLIYAKLPIRIAPKRQFLIKKRTIHLYIKNKKNFSFG